MYASRGGGPQSHLNYLQDPSQYYKNQQTTALKGSVKGKSRGKANFQQGESEQKKDPIHYEASRK